MTLGRDFLRLLQSVSNIPVFHELLKDMNENPGYLHSEFYGLRQIWRTPTPTEFLVSLIPLDMQFKITFILYNVSEKLYPIYWGRFVRRFIPRPEAESIYPDLIRFICCVTIPQIEVLRSKVIVQRWQLIKTLLSGIQSFAFAQLSKLALFTDWLFYDSNLDTFMILGMFTSRSLTF